MPTLGALSSLFYIYKSGAGSGKTYTLTREYLRLALMYDSPWAYKQILAVTFTKKAAREMKTRILGWLKEFSEAEDLSTNPKAQELLSSINCNAIVLKKRASKMHEHILHHYSDFSVQTIDSFVHRIIKSFSRDLQLSTDFEVEMDIEKVITEVVSDQLRDMGENGGLTNTLQNFLEHQLDEEKSTRLKTELVKFFQANSDEKAQENLEQLSATNFEEFEDVKKTIAQRASTLKKEILRIQSNMQGDISAVENNITNHLKNWILAADFSKFIAYGKTPITCLDKGNIFTGKVLDSGAEFQVANELILTHLDAILPLLDEYLVVSKLVKSCYLLALIQDYKYRFNNYKQENNTILISDFTKIIQDVVQDNPAPFIYERLGERYKYYLIDEFQDTSITQWQNFLPLITHTLAKGNMSLLVGDSKQAIYRWRNGDFKLFANLPKMEGAATDYLLKEAQMQLSSSHEIKTLNKNYRSSAEVVQFNNDLFTGFTSALSETGVTMYQDAAQEPTILNSDGFVEFQIFDKESTKDGQTPWLDRILQIISECGAKQFNRGDIAILTRKNKSLSEIATFLNSHGIRTSSQEGLLLKNNLKVNLILGVLKAVAYPLDDQNNTQLFTLIETWSEGEPDLILHPTELKNYTSSKGRQYVSLMIWKYLEKHLGPADYETWRKSSALDALQRIINYLQLDKTTDDYVETLLDFAFTAARRGENSIREFIEYWHENDQLSLATQEDTESVKLMTVHRSKGLEFPVVIYAEPFSQSRSNSIWYDISELNLPLERTFYKDGGFLSDHQGSSPKFSSIKSTAKNETEDKYLDALNILYVATTRASQHLFVLGSTVSDPLIKSVIEIFKNVFSHDIKSEIFCTGTFANKRTSPASDTQEKDTRELTSSLKSYNWQDRVAYRFSSKDLTTEESSSITERTTGIALHSFLSTLAIVDNWDLIWPELIKRIEDLELINGLKKLSLTNEWKIWFSEPTRILNEKRLLDHDGKEYIPDRVMEFKDKIILVDYKAGAAYKHHQEQALNYVKLLKSLTDKPVIGKLVYIREARIETVDDTGVAKQSGEQLSIF